MRWIAAWRERCRALVFRDRQEAELDEELRFHLEHETARLMREAGLGPREARRQARVDFGGVERFKEEVREARGIRVLDDLGKDVRYGARGLAKNRAFTAVAVISLALGIGVNTAVFSVVDAMLLHPFPYDDPDRLVWIGEMDLQNPGGGRSGLRVAEYRSLTQHTGVFEAVAFYEDGGRIAAGGTQRTVASEGHPPERLWGMWVSANLFTMLGVQPLLGRGFFPEDPPVPIICETTSSVRLG